MSPEKVVTFISRLMFIIFAFIAFAIGIHQVTAQAPSTTLPPIVLEIGDEVVIVCADNTNYEIAIMGDRLNGLTLSCQPLPPWKSVIVQASPSTLPPIVLEASGSVFVVCADNTISDLGITGSRTNGMTVWCRAFGVLLPSVSPILPVSPIAKGRDTYNLFFPFIVEGNR
jgi:hypothetical protein